MKNFYWLIFLGLLASCVTNKKVQYLQNGDVNAKNLRKDSLYRSYDEPDSQYHVQPEDIVSIKVESLTPEEFDIYNRGSGLALQAAQSTGATMGAGGGASGGTSGAQGNYLLLGELVDHHGEVPFLLTGKVHVAGLTIYQIQDSLQRIADRYLKSPIVRARLLNYRFTVLGEVPKEGMIPSYNNRISVLEAIGMAGGLGELADRANVKLIRQINGKAEVYYINLLNEQFLSSPVYFVHQGDVIIVPPLKQRTFRKYFSQNLAIFLTSASIFLLTLNLLKP